LDANLFEPAGLHDAGDTGRIMLRSLLLICILSTALAWRASIQVTGRPSRLSSVHSHVVVVPVSRPTRIAPAAFDLTNAGIASGRNQLRLLARPILSRSPHRSMSASTTRPVPRSIPLLLSIAARPDVWVASCVPGLLILSPSSGSIPELPNVAKVV